MLSYKAYSQTDFNVSNLSQGTCWARNLEDSSKISDFQNNQAFEISLYQIGEYLSNLIGFKNIPDRLSSTLHCGSFGHSLIFNFEIEQKKYCIWSYFKNGKFKLISLGSSENEFGACDGQVLGSLLLKLATASTHEKALVRLNQLKNSDSIKNFEFITNTLVHVKLQDKDYFLEEIKAKKLIQFKEFSYYEQETLYHPVGDLLNLAGLSFQNSP